MHRAPPPSARQPFFPSTAFNGVVQPNESVHISRFELLPQAPVTPAARPVSVHWLELKDGRGYVYDRHPETGHIAWELLGDVPDHDDDTTDDSSY